jgi:hypothetical protein
MIPWTRHWLVSTAVLAGGLGATGKAEAQVLTATETTFNDPTNTYASYLVTFSPNSPGTLLSTVQINGADLGTPASGNPNGQQFIVSGIDWLDYRSYGMGYQGGVNQRVYNIDFATGLATALTNGPFVTTQSAAFNFNAVRGVIRTTSEAGANVQINPTTGVITANTNFAYAAGDPNAGQMPIIATGAYSQHGVIDGFDPRLYVIDARGTGTLAQVGTPGDFHGDDAGQLHTVGPLDLLFSIPVNARLAFYIPPYSSTMGFAAIEKNGIVAGHDTPSELFSINLTTGLATDLGQIGVVPGAGPLTVWGLTAVPEPGSLALLGAAAIGVVGYVRRRRARCEK